MIGIAVLCLLLCGGVLAFALNPDMTGSLAQMLYGLSLIHISEPTRRS